MVHLANSTRSAQAQVGLSHEVFSKEELDDVVWLMSGVVDPSKHSHIFLFQSSVFPLEPDPPCTHGDVRRQEG